VIEEALKAVQRHTTKPPEAPLEEPVLIETAPAESSATTRGSALPEDASAEVQGLRAQLEFSQAKGRELLEKLREEHERTKQAQADLEATKKRSQKDKEEQGRFGQEKLVKDFLPVMDNLDRALEHAVKSQDLPAVLKGLEMVRKLMEDTLGRHGAKGFSAVGQPFDPRLHEAMNHVETADAPANSVVAELVRGYTLHERLMRPALVSVAKPPTSK
jgi:molecular chaperone GrpE